MSSVTAVPLRPTRRATLIALWTGIAVLVLAALLLAWAGTKSQVAMAQPAEEFLAQNAKRSGVVTTASGLQYQVEKEGAGPKATSNDLVRVNYDGKLANGESFDSSSKHGGAATLPVGGLIPGWVEGLQLMNKGAKYRFWIPPSLGYGPQGAGDGVIPPNAVLVFDVEVLDIAARPPMIPGMGGMGGAMPMGGMDQAPQQ
jgi:FKBP-type peptidyl-prolyl cis-trans isomerase FkpA